jgi:hypothetical protein
MGKIDKVKVKKGRLISVKNTKKAKFSTASEAYISVWVEDADGKNARCILLTQSQLKAAENRALRNKEDLTEKPRTSWFSS